MIYISIALVSLLVSALLVFILHNVNAIIDAAKYFGERQSVINGCRLHLMRYVVRNRLPPFELEIRHSPYHGKAPSPIFDGTIRRPWGW